MGCRAYASADYVRVQATHPEPARPGITYEMCRPVTALDEEESEDIVFS